MKKLVIINLVILLELLLLYLYPKYFYLIFSLIVVSLIVNFYFIYKKSNTLDENEKKQKIILHKIKNSLSIILGFNQAFNDNLISKKDLEDNLNKEIDSIIQIIKNEIYRK